MLERFAAQVLNKYIGQYVENFNPQNLSIGIVQGAVELENLQIRKDALKEFDVPGINVKWGLIGKITLRIPSYRNYSEPWVIDINKLYLIAGPCANGASNFDEETEQANKKEKKNRKLLELEERWHASQGSSKSIYAIWRSYSSSIVTNIVENLQIRLFDLHIRYEDNETLLDSFAFGMHISELSTETTDEKWEPITNSKLNADKKWKKMKLKALSFYWDTKSRVLDEMFQDELISAMSDHVGSEDDVDLNEPDRFVLHPVNGDARLTRVCTPYPLRSRTNPRLTLDVDFPEIFLNLTKNQYDQLLAFSNEVARWHTQMQNRRYRPTVDLRSNPRKWWQWAINSHISKIQLRRKTRSMEFLLKRANLIVQYVKTYKAYLNAKYVQKSAGVKDKSWETSMEEMRSEMSFAELAILHDLVYGELDAVAQDRKSSRKNSQLRSSKKKKFSQLKGNSHQKKRGWPWRGWLGAWKKSSSESEEEESFLEENGEGHELTSSSELPCDKRASIPDAIDAQNNPSTVSDSLFKDLNDDEIFEMFGDELSDEDTTDTFLMRDSVLLKLNFALNSGKLLLKDQTNIGFISLEFNDVNIKSEWRPRYSTHQITLDLGSIHLRDLNPLNAHFCDLITPSTRQTRPQSPVGDPPNGENRKKQADSWSTFLPFPTTKPSDPATREDAEHRGRVAVLSITYEKLSDRNTQFSDRLEVITAPLCLTFVPGLTDKLKRFFQTPPEDKQTNKAIKSEMLAEAARQRYDLWMRQTRAEVQNAVNRVIKGKETSVKVDKRKWAVSLDIFAPDILIPEDWTSSNSSMIVLSLGHMTFANHSESLSPPGTDVKKTVDDAYCAEEGAIDELFSDDDDYATPFATPPTEPCTLDKVKTLPEEEEPSFQTTEHFIDQEFLTERMLWDKMYERYHVTFADLQILVVPNRSKWGPHRFGARGPMHLIERFTVELTAEQRSVPTLDPNYPALLITGQLPHLILHISHKKIHTAMKCLRQIQEKYQSRPPPAFNKQSHDATKVPRAKSGKSSKLVDESKVDSKKLVCDFLINQVSVVLEEDQENQIMSVLEVSRIQTKFVERTYDSTVSFSIYSLLLVDVMQQLGHDYELLLASHRRVSMEVDSGNILDSGTASPDEVPRTVSATAVQSNSNISHQKRNTADSPEGGNLPTNSVLTTVADTLREFTKFSDKYFSPHRFDFVASSAKSTQLTDDTFQYLITLEIKSLRKGSSQLKTTPNGSLQLGPDSKVYPCTDITAKFSNLDVVFNAKSWVTILNFLHKLKPVFPKQNSDSIFLDASQENGFKFDEQVSRSRTFSGQSDDGETKTRTFLSIDFKKLNILIMRHVTKFGNTVGRKISTVTMQGAHTVASILPQSEAHGGRKLEVTGSIASLQMHDLTSSHTRHTGAGYEILSVGMQDKSLQSTEIPFPSSKSADVSADEKRALSFNFTQSSHNGRGRSGGSITKLAASVPTVTSRTPYPPGDSNPSDTLLFDMDGEEMQADATGLRTESRLIIRLASTCYIHSPRLIAEVLAFADEINDFVAEEMTSATRQAYREMAKSIMEKVTDYSKSMLGGITEDTVDSSSLQTQSASNYGFEPLPTLSNSHSVSTFFSLQINMRSPILAFPKSPGSFELLVAHLGKITVRNDVGGDSSQPVGKLLIEVENMNLRSDRRRNEELNAKKAADATSKSSAAPGPSIAKLKEDSILFMRSLEDGTLDITKTHSTQILHKTSLHFTVEQKDFTPTTKSTLDVRHCCDRNAPDHCSSNRSCAYFTSHVGAISERKMYLNVSAMSALTVTLSKPAYEQLLKTLDNISYGNDIDLVADYVWSSVNDDGSNVHQSASAPDLHETNAQSPQSLKAISKNFPSSRSYQSTPRHKEAVLFNVPELEIPKQQSLTFPVQNITTRKYTPISADINIPSLIFQLSGDLSEGEQGLVKVTLERFVAAYKKENRFATQIDLSLGSLDIEDLLQPEESKDRHIVVSSKKKSNRESKDRKTIYLSASCPAFIKSNVTSGCCMSASLPSFQPTQMQAKKPMVAPQTTGLFRPYDSIHNIERLKKVEAKSQPATPRCSEQSKTTSPNDRDDDVENTLVKITTFLVDGNSAAYSNVYDRVNRNINVDFNSLDCKVNLQTWVVLLDFFGIGTSPKKQYQLDPETEQTFSVNQQLEVRSFYENQPNDMINSEIKFTVRSFNLIFNKVEYELLKANVGGLQSQVQIRDAMLRVRGQLGTLSVSDLSPNGFLYRERFIFTGDKAIDFDIKKHDEPDDLLKRDFDISMRLRMSSIRYVHTQRFQNETIAFCQHFQQLQEVLGRMRAASVGQSVKQTSRRQSRVLLDIQADAPIILIPESSHSHRLLVANLGHITVKNEFRFDRDPGTLSYRASKTSLPSHVPDLIVFDDDQVTSPNSRGCLLDVIHVNLIDMDLFTATFVRRSKLSSDPFQSDVMQLVFSSYIVTCNPVPLLKEKVKFELQMERNLDKELKHDTVPDTALSARLSSVYCAINHEQFWLIRGVLDHNAGETIPDFPQPTAFLQPSKAQTVLTGNVFIGLSMDFYLTNVSIELLRTSSAVQQTMESFGRLDFVKSKLSYRAFSDGTKTTNLSCEAFRAHDTRFLRNDPRSAPHSVFATILGPMESRKRSPKSVSSKLQFELFQRTGPGYVEFTALLNNMRVYLIVDWMTDMTRYLLENPNQGRCDSLRAKTAQLMHRFGHVDSGNQQKMDSSGQLLPQEQAKEFKINFTNTEFVLIEDTSQLDSDGVILRSTAVLGYFPDRKSTPSNPSNSCKPIMSCSLQSLEVFSCQLNKENETALSIIDPVTINFEVRPIKQSDLSSEEINIDPSVLDKLFLDAQVSQLNIRVSYNDVMLFLNILNSLTGKINKDLSIGGDKKIGFNQVEMKWDSSENVASLTEIGYSPRDAIHALAVSNGNVQSAGSWLVENAKLEEREKIISIAKSEKKSLPLALARMCLNIDVVRLCLIDDCADDCDVPLTEMAVRNLAIRQALSDSTSYSYKELLHGQIGSATFNLSGDYYNRKLSLWEPFLEPWRCNVSWRHKHGQIEKSPGQWKVEMQASDRFDLTVTSALIETVKKTTSTWRQDYERVNQSPRASLARKRLPLVAYVLRNLTGSPLFFATQTTTLRQETTSGTSVNTKQVATWQEVLAGDEKPFNFATMHEKQRHKRTASLKLHQIIVQVGEWNVFQPVTVSKVGVYFRHAFKKLNKSSRVYEHTVPVRVVFSVTLEGNAQKVVTVRSALAVRSRVKIPVQLQLLFDGRDVTMPILDPEDTQYIPLDYIYSPIKIRPSVSSPGIPYTYNYSDSFIVWQAVTADKKEESMLIECVSTTTNQPRFFFAVCIQCHPYPSYEEVSEMLHPQGEAYSDLSVKDNNLFLPGHTIIILPPVVISNLLPCDLRYYIKNKDIEGALKPGIDATPHAVQVSPSRQSSLIIGCLIDGYQNCRELVIPATVKNFQMRMLMKDYNNRTLILNVRVLWRLGCSVRVSIMAGYWIVNKTGLPIVVKQEGSQADAAGQYKSHEQARSLQPLLFSYANREAPYLCTMRLGNNAQLDDLLITGGNRKLRGVPAFCERFSTDGGSCTRNLRLFIGNNSPNREFCIGVSVRRGWGRYLHTHIVTIAPRFLLINKTKCYRLNFAQRHAISYSADSSGVNCHLAIIPGSSCVFHWPRVDLDTLLCVRLADEPSCHWSGGFSIDRTNSFHIALRLAHSSILDAPFHSFSPHCIFLTVEVTLVDATYCVLVSDADPAQVPPPLRIDNVSLAPIIFKQVGTDPSFNTEVAPGSQLAYACDEPCLPPKINCCVKGDSNQVELDMNVVGEEKQLYYKNYFYITVGTKPSSVNRDPLVRTVMVLDVQKNNNFHEVILQPFRSGKRSQLWRMTSNGRIFHEGSSPPENKSSTSYSDASHARSSGLVLDIAEMSHNVGRSFDRGIPLTLKRMDEQRGSTQTWQFAEDHRMKCRHKGLSVQVAELSPGQRAVLASYNNQRVCLPTEMCYLQKLIPGSGVLSLKVVRDGPTRVIRIVDIRQKRAGISHSDDWTVLESSGSSVYETARSEISSGQMRSSSPTYSVSINMVDGVGISLISNSPEELVYMTMNGVNIDISADRFEQTLSLSMQKFQVDNQLLDGYPPVMLHPRLNSSPPTLGRSPARSNPVERPLVSVHAVRQQTSSRTYEIYKSLTIDVGKLTISLEERLILKLFQFIGFSPASSSQESQLLDETKLDSALSLTNLIRQTNQTTLKRYYFDMMRLSMEPVRLSVYTASRLTPELKAMKRAFAFPLIQFERAPVTLQDYVKYHLFETMSFVLADLSKHIREQLKSQAAIILGSIDFLGNPIGLLSDVKAGIHAGLGHGNVQNMTKHITHGLSNTTAKFTGALSDKIGGLAMDDEYDDKRKAIQANARSSASGHVVAGLQGLMAGVVGGLTSVVTQPVKGAQNDGASGFFKGVLKGVVGTVTKPVAGVLDLASESASAVRHISVSPDQIASRTRPIRCCHSFQGCLQYYSKLQADGQVILYAINSNDFSEFFYSCDSLNFSGGDQDMLVLITNKRVCFVRNGEPDVDHILFSVNYSHLVDASVINSDQSASLSSTQKDSKVYLEVVMKSALSATGHNYPYQQGGSTRYYLKRPRIECQSLTVAERVCQKILYAKNLASEQSETMSMDPKQEINEDRAFELEV